MIGEIISSLLGGAISGGSSTSASFLAIDEHDDTLIGVAATMSIASTISLGSIEKLKSSDIAKCYVDSLSENQLAELSERIEAKEKNFIMETEINDRDVVAKVKTNGNKRI